MQLPATITAVEQYLAESLARRLGLEFDEAVLLGEGMNVLVELRPAPVVARVTRLAHLVRSTDALVGGIGLAKALGRRAVPPSDLIDPGPHVEGGRYIAFWTYHVGAAASPAEAGAACARSTRRPRHTAVPCAASIRARRRCASPIL